MPATATPAALPDVNAPTHPFEDVRRALDRVGWLSLYAVPVAPADPWLTPVDRTDYFGLHAGYGLDLRCELRRFDAVVGTAGGVVVVAQSIGETVAELRGKLLVSRRLPEWAPGAEPDVLFFDPWRREHFSLLDVELAFAAGGAMRGYAIGRTFPILVHGAPTLAACAVGDLEGSGAPLAGAVATLVLDGAITPGLGFQGSVSIRIPDPPEGWRSEISSGRTALRPGSGSAVPTGDPATYLCLRGEKASPSVRTEYGPSPGGGLVRLDTPARMHSTRFSLAGAAAGPGPRLAIGPRVAELSAAVELDILAPPGTPRSPNPFTTRNLYTFVDESGCPIGTITADVELGRSFDLALPGLPGQAAMRYGGFGLVVDGTGPFLGARGTLAVNSAIGVAPHALSMLNVLRIVDPDGVLRGGSSSGGLDRAAEGGGGWEREAPGAARIVYMFDPPAERPHPPPSRAAAAGAPAAPPSSAPPLDLNRETHPFREVQAALDEAAFLGLACLPAAPPRPVPSRAGGVRSLATTSRLHGLDVEIEIASAGRVGASGALGDAVGSAARLWVPIPHDHVAVPGRTPPETDLDLSRPQRLALSEDRFELADGADGFAGFGTGATFPAPEGGGAGGRMALVAAVGTITRGWGRLAGAVGTYVSSGRLSIERGFEGNVVVRIAGADPALRSSGPAPRALSGSFPRGLTFLALRGQKASPGDQTELVTGPDGVPSGFSLHQELRRARLWVSDSGGTRAGAVFGGVIGRMTSEVRLDLREVGRPAGTASPVPFASRNRFVLTDGGGREIGSFVAAGGEGRTFDLALPGLPGQRALRFGAFQPVTGTTGAFAGVTALLTDNSAVGVAPHATATLYTLCIVDPDGRFRTGPPGAAI